MSDDEDEDVPIVNNGVNDIDFNLPDGKWAPDFVGRSVTLVKTTKRDGKKVYHGQVTNLKRGAFGRTMFSCFFEEDQKSQEFSYKDLKAILDKPTTPEVNLYAEDIIDEARTELAHSAAAVEDDEYLPDIVPTRREMLQQKDRQQFIDAEGVEIENMAKHGVLKFVEAPKNVRLVKSKFTYKRKRDKHGMIVKYKARLVAKGFTQIFGVDFSETFAPVATATAFRILMVIAMLYNLEVTAGDIEGAFLNGELEEDIYMAPPDGYQDPTGKRRVFKLLKSIYGLKQSANCWFKLLRSVMCELGYVPLDASDCFWLLYNGPDMISLVVIHVDDWVHAFSNKFLDDRLVKEFTERWGVSDVGPVKFHLGMSVDYVRGRRVRISQRPYFEKLLKRFNFVNARPISTPMDPNVKLTTADCPAEPNEDDKRLYAEMYGSILYAAVTTRPDLAKAMTTLGKFMQNPGPSHMQALKRILRYIAGTLDYGLEYVNEPWLHPAFDYPIPAHVLLGFADSDWAGELDKFFSTSGACTFLAGGPIAWRAVFQRIQAQSTAEAEYIAMGDESKDIMYIRNILEALGFYHQLGPTRLLVDSTAAIAIASKPGLNSKTKHIALRYHFIRQLIADGVIAVEKISTLDNVADILTKAVDRVTFERLVPRLVKRMTD